MDSINNNTFAGGMNMDIDAHLVPSNTYTYALNIRNSPSGNEGVITNVKGNELVTYTLQSGGNKVIGAVDYTTGSKTYYLMWNSGGAHSVYQYDWQLNEISTVFTSSILDFKSDSLVSSINVVPFRNNTLLLWTDGQTEPKKILIEAGIRTFDPVKKVFVGFYTTPYPYNEGDVVVFTFGADFYDRTVYYLSKKYSNTTVPYTSLNNPVATDDWEIIQPGYIYPVVPQVTENNVTQIPEPPIKAPVVAYKDNESLKTNRLKGSMWQFAFRYKYADGQLSALSPFSKVPVPVSQVNPLDNVYVPEYLDNNIEVQVPLPNNAMIQSIKVYARAVPDSLAAMDFFEFAEVFANDYNQFFNSVDSEPTSLVYFTNQEDKVAVDQTDASQLFYYVPRYSVAQEISGDNRVLHANGVYGYDVDQDIFKVDSAPSLKVSYADALNLTEFALPITGTVPTIPAYGGSPGVSFDINTIATLEAGDVIRISFSGDIRVYQGLDTSSPYPSGYYEKDGVKKFAFNYNYTVSEVDVATLSSAALKAKVALDISKQMNACKISSFGYRDLFGADKQQTTNEFYIKGYNSSPNVVTIGTLKGEKVTVSDTYWTMPRILEIDVTHITGQTLNARGFKRGSTQIFGLVYSDGYGRVSNVLNSEDFKVNVDWYSGTSSTGNGLASISMQINNLAPEWATKCHIVKKRDNGISNFIQLPLSVGNLNEDATLNGYTSGLYFVVGRISDDGITSTNNYGNIETVNIYLNALNGSGVNSYNNTVPNSVLEYSFTKGDRLRFISSKNKTAYFADDVEILGYNDTLNYITINRKHLNQVGSNLLHTFLDKSNEEEESIVGGAIFEIYTPKSTEDLTGFYYETGITLDIVDRYHIGTDGVAQDASNSAKVDLDCGDVYYKSRWYSIKDDVDALVTDGDYYVVEDYNYNDAYLSRATNVGRFNLKITVDTEEGTQERSGINKAQYKPNIIFFSEKYIQGTDVNRLGTIYDTSFKETDANFGSIQFIYSEGDTLTIFQEDRVGMAYNSRSVTTDLSGNQVVASVKSEPVISDIIYYKYRGGISNNPESFANKFWVDIRRGTVCVLSQNGIDELQFKGINKYVKDLAKLSATSSQKSYIIGAYDKRNEEYVINFRVNLDSVPFNYAPSIPGETADFFFTIPEGGYSSQFVVGTEYYVESTQEKPSLISPSDLYFLTFIVNRVEDGKVYCNFKDTYESPEFKNNYKVPMYNSEVVAYSARLNAWVSFYSYIADFISESGIDIITWKDGNLYLHDSDTANRANFYGEDFNSEIEIVANDKPSLVKRFLSLIVKDNSMYNVTPEYYISTREDSVISETKQVSDLQQEDFEYKEGSWYAHFLRDKTTPNLTYPLLDGDYLIGRWLKVRVVIENGSTTVREIFSIFVNSVVSFFAK